MLKIHPVLVLTGVAVLTFAVSGPMLRAEEEVAVKDKVTQIRSLQEEQRKLTDDYNRQKEELDKQLQEKLKAHAADDEAVIRQDLMQEARKQQEELKKDFQEKLREAQKKERKLRTGREDLYRTDLEAAMKEAQGMPSSSSPQAQTGDQPVENRWNRQNQNIQQQNQQDMVNQGQALKQRYGN